MRPLLPVDDILVDGTLEAAIYPRVSGGAQEDGYSLDTQQAAMLVKARELGWRVRRSNIFRETHTGMSSIGIPALDQPRRSVCGPRAGAPIESLGPRFTQPSRRTCWLAV